MKTKILKISNKFISYILAILGVGLACSNGGCMYGSPMEYGVPNATFKVLGKVTTEQNVAIKGIRVAFPYDTTFTDNQGNYMVKTVDFPADQSIPIHFKDIDLTLNGEFKDLDTIAKFENPKFIGGNGNWNKGGTEIELNIKLKPVK